MHRQTKAQFSFMNSCQPLPKETNMLKEIINGLNITVYAFPDSDRNAFVIPGFYVGCDKNYQQIMKEYKKTYPYHDLRNPFCVGNDFFSILLSSQLKQLVQMRKFSYANDPNKPGKRKIFFKNVQTPISVFVTYGMLNNATPEERVAIYLHEIGHWVDAALSLPNYIIKHPDKESIFLYSNMIYKRFCTRYQELTADKFAKDLGYGKELASGLRSLISVRKQISWIYRFGDWVQKRAIEQNNEDERTGIYGHWGAAQYPSMDTRISYLEDET